MTDSRTSAPIWYQWACCVCPAGAVALDSRFVLLAANAHRRATGYTGLDQRGHTVWIQAHGRLKLDPLHLGDGAVRCKQRHLPC